MSYIFSDDGIFGGYYNDGDARVFILEKLNQSLPQNEVTSAIRGCTPTHIAGLRVMLYMREPVLRDMAATVYSESGHNRDESEGIARVIRNRAQHLGVNYSSSNFWRSSKQGGIDGQSMYGRNTPRYRNANNQGIENWTGNMLSDLESKVRALVNSADITKGAYFWEGTGLLNRPGNYFGTRLNRRPPVFQVTVRHGHTTFMRYNPNHPKFGRSVYP